MTLSAREIDRYTLRPGSYQLSSESRNLMIFVLIIGLVVAAILYYVRGGGGWGLTLLPATEKRPSANITQAKVAASTLYLREGPGTQYEATYLLPQNWQVSILGESQVGNDGDAWVKVRLETPQGVQEGWVNRKYLAQ